MYIEWFLLDNTLMNYLMLNLAGALLAKPPGRVRVWIAALGGGILAAVALAFVPQLLALPGKLLLCALMSFPFLRQARDFPRVFFALMVSAMLSGGCIYACTFLLGGSFSGGVLLAAPPLRIVLLGGTIIAVLPRIIRGWHQRRIQQNFLYPMRLTQSGRTIHFQAFLDTGNALEDPLSGLPVILIAGELMPPGNRKPIPCETVTGQGMLYAIRPEKLEILHGTWQEIHALIAASPVKILQADALIGAAVFPNTSSSGKETLHHEIS